MTGQSYKIGDCLELMKEIPDKSIDLVIADPPYYRIDSNSWDRQWRTFNDYLAWLELRVLEIKRVLKDNGSFYIFGDDHRIAYIQVMLDKYFTFLNHLIWYKRNNQSIKGAENSCRRFACVSERILFYSLQDQTGLETIKLDVDNFKPLRQYFKDFQDALVISKAEIVEKIGQQADHCFRWGSSQWDLPTKETYLKLCELPLKYEFVRKEYEDLRKEYEDLRRPFYYQHTYEIIDIPIINQNDNTPHSTTKPLKLVEKLIKASSNQEAVVLDPFLGSGTTLEACMNLDRNCIGFEIDSQWEPIYKKRLKLDNLKLAAWNFPTITEACNPHKPVESAP